jgi:hypothetical protein
MQTKGNLFLEAMGSLGAPPPQPMQLPQNLSVSNQLQAVVGDDDKKKKKKEEPYDMGAEMRLTAKKPLKYDNKTAPELIKLVAQKTGVNPNLLYSSSYQEGLNKAIVKADETEKFLKEKGWFNQDYPVSGYDLYGLDTFGGRFEEFVKKGYLPKEFANRFVRVDMENDHMKKVVDPKTGKATMVPDPQQVSSADFKTNEDALMAKAAFLRASSDTATNTAKQMGLTLDEDAANYFTMVAYNAGEGNMKKMLQKYAAAKDKKAFIENGDANWQSVHKNVSPRMKNMLIAKELLEAQQAAAAPAMPIMGQ